MTYCLAIRVEEGLVFASDSRTHAGVDQVATYSKMHRFGVDGERQLVLLSAGNLATTQAVLARMRRDIEGGETPNLMSVSNVEEAAEYLGSLLRERLDRDAEAVAAAGFSAEASFIIGGQIGGRPHRVYMVYPQGNYITTSEETPYLQIGETKYGKPVLDRFIRPDTSLDEAVVCALVSMDSTMRSNASVGPPIEVLRYDRDSLVVRFYLRLEADDPYLLEIRRSWTEGLRSALQGLPPVDWRRSGEKPLLSERE